MYKPGDDEVCFFVKDPQSLVKDYLEDHGNGAVTKVLGVDELRKEYGTHESRRELLGMYDLFLVDNRVAPMMPGLLGNAFLKAKKMPLMVDMRKDIVHSIKRAIASTAFTLRQGTSSSLRIGNADFSSEQLIENVMAAIDGVTKRMKGGWDDIQSLSIKTNTSPALPIYLALPTATKQYVKPKSANLVDDGKIKKRRRKKKSKEARNVKTPEVDKVVSGSLDRQGADKVEVTDVPKKSGVIEAAKEASQSAMKKAIDVDVISLLDESSEEEEVKPVRRVRPSAIERATALAEMFEEASESDDSQGDDADGFINDEDSESEQEEKGNTAAGDKGNGGSNQMSAKVAADDEEKPAERAKALVPDEDCSYDSSLPRDMLPIATPTRRSTRVAKKPKLFGEEQAKEELHAKVRKAATPKRTARKVKESARKAEKESGGKPPIGKKTEAKKAESFAVAAEAESGRVTRRSRPLTAESSNVGVGRTTTRKTRAGSVDSTGMEAGERMELRRSARKRGPESEDSAVAGEVTPTAKVRTGGAGRSTRKSKREKK